MRDSPSTVRSCRGMTRLVCGALLLGLLGAPAALAAQEGPPFEPPGPPPGLEPPVGHDRSGVPPAHSQGPLLQSPMDPGVVAALRVAGVEVESALARGSLLAPSGQSISPVAQRQLLHVFRGGGQGNPEALTAALAPSENGRARSAARDLVEGLQVVRGEPAKLGEVVVSYNRFIDASSVDFLQSPPSELLAIQATLGTMIEAATRQADDGKSESRE